MTTVNAIHELVKSVSGLGELGITATGENPVDFFYTCPTGNPYLQAQIDVVNIVIVDTTIFPNNFGAIANGIANGVEIDYVDKEGIVLKSFTEENPIRRNLDWGIIVSGGVDFSGGGSGALAVNWTITGKTLILGPGQSLRFRIQDDLSSLDDFIVMVHGSFRFGGNV